MSKSINGGKRQRNARETYVEQLPYGRSITGGMAKKRETFTNMDPLDNTELAYRSTSNYLRQIAQQGMLSPTEMITARNVPRTKSASEITPRNNLNRSMSGNPRYKAQEDYYDEIQIMKKDMKTIKDENSNLRAKIRRLEEDNARKRKEIDALYDSSKDGDLRRTLSGSTTDRNNNNPTATNVVMSLKQRVFKLELQLKQKEAAVEELKSDPRWTKGTEFELQNRALLGELQRQKAERLNYIQKNDYDGSFLEEQKNAVRKLTREKDELQQENQSLKRKVRELEKSDRSEPLSTRRSDDHGDKELLKQNEDLKHDLNRANKDLQRTQHELDQVQNELEQANKNLQKMKHEKSKEPDEDLEEIKRERDQFREKSNRANRELNEVKRERDQYKEKLDLTNEKLAEVKRERDQYKNQLERAREESPKPNQHNRSSPVPTPLKRSQPSIIENPIGPASTSVDNLERDAKKNRPTSGTHSNEAAVKNVQASIRGHLNRSEMDKTPDSSAFKPVPARGRDPPSDTRVSPSPASGSPRHSPSFADKGGGSRPTSPIELKKTGPGDRDSSSKLRQSTASPTDNRRPSPTVVDRGGGSKPNIRDELNKTGPSDRDSSSKLRQSTASPTDNRRPSPTVVDRGGGSKPNIHDELNKTGPSDRDSSSKLRQPTASPTDNRRSSPTVADRSGGSKPNIHDELKKTGSGDRDSSSKLRQSTASPTDIRRSSPNPVDSGGAPKPNPRDDRKKPGPDNRDAMRDRDLSTKQGPPSSSTNLNSSQSVSSRRPARPLSPEAPRPPTKKSPSTSKQSLKEIPSGDDDDDVMY